MSLIKAEAPVVQNLGEIATEIRNFQIMVSEMFADPMGCGECTDLIAAHVESMEVLFNESLKKKYGLDENEAREEMEKRTSARWMYFNF